MGIYILPEKKKSVYISATIGLVLAIIIMSIGFNVFVSIVVFLSCLTFTTTMQRWKSPLIRHKDENSPKDEA